MPRNWLNLRQDAQTALVEMRELQKGKLTIAANEFTALYLFARVGGVSPPASHHQDHRAALARSHIPDDVLKHNVELGVLSYDPQEPQLRSAVVYLDELALVVPPGHPLASAGEVSVRQLGAESFVAHIVASPYRDKVIEAFQRHKTPLHMDVELPTLQAIKRFVCMGNGVALVPEISVETKSLVETWCAFRSAICIFSASCASCTARNPVCRTRDERSSKWPSR